MCVAVERAASTNLLDMNDDRGGEILWDLAATELPAIGEMGAIVSSVWSSRQHVPEFRNHVLDGIDAAALILRELVLMEREDQALKGSQLS